MTRRRGAAFVVVVALAAGACSGGGDPSGPVALDGSPRKPDTAGVIDSVERDAVVIDGKRFKLAETVQVFSTSTLKEVPLLGRVRQYVQVGTAGSTVEWMAVFGVAAEIPGRGPTTYYTGELKDIDGDDLVFKDGTVLRAASDVDVPDRVKGRRVNAEIDTERDRVRTVVVAAS